MLPNPAPRRGGGGGASSEKLTLVRTSQDNPPPTTPARERLERELHQRGVTSARKLALWYRLGRIELAIRAWDLQVEAGEDVGPGLLVWYIREGVEPRERDQKGAEDWLERRYRKGKKVDAR